MCVSVWGILPATLSVQGKEIIYEAEDAILSEVIVDTKHTGYSGTGFTDYYPNAPGGYIEWHIDVADEGDYILKFRYANGASENRPAEIAVNDVVIESELAFDSTSEWSNWETTQTIATLKKGKNTIRATANGPSGGGNIDYLAIEYVFDQIFEAEDADFEAVIVDTKHVGYTGTGFTDYYPNAPGGYIEWHIEVPIEGMYALVFRYANGASENRPAEIKVNGVVADPDLAFDSTSEWTSWQTTQTIVMLKEGSNVIRATATGASGGGNIDNLRVCTPSILESDDNLNAPVDYEVVSTSKILGEILSQKLSSAGLLVEDDYFQKNPVTRVAFINGMNQIFGFLKEEQFKNLEITSKVWEISTEEWYAYVLETAQEAGYIQGNNENLINPLEPITRQEVAVILSHLLELEPQKIPESLTDESLIPDWSKGFIGAVLNEGYMSVQEDGSFGPTEFLDANEEKQIYDKMERNRSKESIHIVRADAITNDLILVTLDGKFDEIDTYDIMISVPSKSWSGLDPAFIDLQINQVAVGQNMLGNTVLIYQLKETLDDQANYWMDAKTTFSGDLDSLKIDAQNLVSWQMDHGGWTKSMEEEYKRPWDGVEKRSKQLGPDDETELGTIDNNATISQIRFISEIYRETKEVAYKESVEKGLDFLLTMQYPSGGFPQTYPKRGKEGELIQYSNFVTFNDDAMINVLNLFDDILNKNYPFDTGIIDEDAYLEIQNAMDRAVDYILKAQIEVNGQLTAWCAQHDPITYEPLHARSYEHPSISGSESVSIIKFLMSRPEQTDEIKMAIKSALEWFDQVKIDGVRYVSGDANKEFFVEDPNSTTWYRFYDLNTFDPIFSGRDGVIKSSIHEIEEERQMGYSWAGSYATQLLKTAQETGYYGGKVYARVVDENSRDVHGRTLKLDNLIRVNDLVDSLSEIKIKITVAKDGSGDYTTVQGAIDAIPSNNVYPIEIYIKNGIYKEEIKVPTDKSFITMIGESREGTVLTYDNYAGKENETGGTYGTSGSASVYIYANDFIAKDITFENSFDEASVDVSGKQAVAVYAKGDRQKFINCRFVGNQDTLYTYDGTQYYYKCRIEGDVDFIFGGAQAVFDECEIVSLDRGSDNNNGYITAASTLITKPYGYLFINSEILSDAKDGTVYLGRPWHPSGNPDAIASVVFMNSYLGPHIKAEGWTDMSGFKAEDARFYEYKNHGPGVNEARQQLTDEEAERYTIENVLNGWNPKE
jgi:PelA/Pel-15E family pectate lyase